MRCRSPLRAAFAALLLLGVPASAQDAEEEEPLLRQPAIISADEIESDLETQVHVARGNVVIIRGDRKLESDWATFSNVTRQGVASGDVRLSEGPELLRAEFIYFDVDTLTGVVYDGHIDSAESGFRLAGREVRKTGERTYRFKDAEFSTCRCPDEGRPPWLIKAEQADLEIEGYGTARNTTFEVLGVPVLWFPWMIYPLKTERQTGFLFPEFSTSSRNGTEIGIPFFWAVRDNLNLTLRPRWMSERGFFYEAEAEYVFGEESEGRLLGTYIRDRDVDDDDIDTPFDEQRWGVKWEHDQFVGEDVRLRVDMALVSDNEYPFDFDAFREYRPDRFLESIGFASAELGDSRFALVGGVRWADDLQSPEDLDRDDFVLQRLPDVQLAALTEPVGGLGRLVPAFDAHYTYYRSEEDAADEFPSALVVGDDQFVDTGIDSLLDVDEEGLGPASDPALDNFDPTSNPGGSQGDGIFQEGEPLADRGHRLVLTPRLGLPLRLFDLFEVYPEIGYHTTLYQTHAQGFEERGLFTGRIDLKTRLRRIFAMPFGLGDALHLLEPQLGYALVQKRSQRRNPLFVPETAVTQNRVRQLDLDNVTLDSADRIPNHDSIKAALANRVYARAEGGRPGRLLADVTFSTQYLASSGEFGNAYAEGIVYPFPGWRSDFILGYDIGGHVLSEGLLGVSWSSPAGHAFGFQHRYVRDIPDFYGEFSEARDRFEDSEEDFNRINQLSVGARVALPWRLAVTFDGTYSFENSLGLGSTGGVEYVSRCECWAIRAELTNSRNRGSEFHLTYTVMGLGADTLRPFSDGQFDL